MAIGGAVVGGQSYVVGEQGPELFVPQSAGRIIPNDQLMVSHGRQGGMGGDSYDLSNATFILPNVANARQFYDDLKREARRRNRSLAYERAGVQ